MSWESERILEKGCLNEGRQWGGDRKESEEESEPCRAEAVVLGGGKKVGH